MMANIVNAAMRGYFSGYQADYFVRGCGDFGRHGRARIKTHSFHSVDHHAFR